MTYYQPPDNFPPLFLTSNGVNTSDSQECFQDTEFDKDSAPSIRDNMHDILANDLCDLWFSPY